MYTQAEKAKENKSKAIANSVSQKKSDRKQGGGGVDNRQMSLSQKILQKANDLECTAKVAIRERGELKSGKGRGHNNIADRASNENKIKKIHKLHSYIEKQTSAPNIGYGFYACAEPSAVADAIDDVKFNNPKSGYNGDVSIKISGAEVINPAGFGAPPNHVAPGGIYPRCGNCAKWTPNPGETKFF